ncbi:MAG: O-antigen ligase family protein [Acidimicrobiales bacterium]
MHTAVAGPDPAIRPAATRVDFAPEASSLAVAVVLALSMTTVVIANLDDRPGTDYQLHTLLLGSDMALLALVAVAAGGLRSAVAAWRRHACALGALVVGLAMVPAFVVHPSDRGVAALLRWVGAVALALGLGAARRDGRRLIIAALAAVTVAHVVVALAERAGNAPVGLGALGEPSAYSIGGRYASTGLGVHPYVLAAWCAVVGTALLAVGRRRDGGGGLATVAGVVAFVGIGLTMSRAGVLAGLLGLGALLVASRGAGHRRGWRPVAVAALALGLGIMVNLSGWASRADQVGGGVDAISSGRGALLGQAWGLLHRSPLSGVGPGRYVIALSQRPTLVALSDQSPRPVHVTPLLLVVEGGLLVVPALLLLAVAIGRACWRGRAPAVAVTLAMLPFLALDHLAWSYPQGIVLTGVWLGTLDLLASRGRPTPADQPIATPSSARPPETAPPVTSPGST